jgi:hypothetical protein
LPILLEVLGAGVSRRLARDAMSDKFGGVMRHAAAGTAIGAC